MNNVIKTILERWTIRKYRPEQITEDELNAIFEAGLHAPSAGGSQSCMVVVCQNTVLNEEFGKINKLAFGKPWPGSYVSRDQPSIIDDPAISSGFYGAPAVLTLFGPKDFIIFYNTSLLGETKFQNL